MATTIMPYGDVDFDRLRELLRTEPLDGTFEKYGNFVIRQPMLAFKPARLAYPDNLDMVQFFGNFANYSAVFNFDTDDAELIDELEALIRTNQQTPEYAQYKAERAKRDAYWEGRRDSKRRNK